MKESLAHRLLGYARFGAAVLIQVGAAAWMLVLLVGLSVAALLRFGRELKP